MALYIYSVTKTWGRTKIRKITVGHNRPKSSGIMRRYSIKSSMYQLSRKQQEFLRNAPGDEICDASFFSTTF